MTVDVADRSKMSASENAVPRIPKAGKKRGRRSNPARRDAIRGAINTHGDAWREHLGEIFDELDSQKAPLGDFQGMKIDVGEGEKTTVWTWADLGLAEGNQRKQIIDTLRKYTD